MRFKLGGRWMALSALAGGAGLLVGGTTAILALVPFERYLVTTLVVSALDQHELIVAPAHAYHFALGQPVMLRVDRHYYHAYVEQHAKTGTDGQLRIRLGGLTASLPVGSAVPARLILGRTTALATWLDL